MPKIQRKYRIAFLSVFILLTFSPESSSQQDNTSDLYITKLKLFEASFDFVDPTNRFGDKMNTAAYGFAISYLQQTKINRPTFWGITAYWHRYLTVGDIFADLIDNQLVDISRRTSVDLAGMEMLLRFYPEIQLPFIEVYLEGSLGSKFIFTTTRLNIDDTGENIDFFFEESDFTLSYGLSLGLQLNLYDYRYYLNFKSTYSSGSSGTFLALKDDNAGASRPIDQLEEKNAPIEFLRFQIGLSVAF